MPPRSNRAEPPVETPEEHWLREEQTARNVAGLHAEQEGRLQDAMDLYEQNVSEGFEGDWPYGRLVSVYEKRQMYDDAERVLRRAIEVFESGTRRTPQDRRVLVQTFRKRLTLLTRTRRKLERGTRGVHQTG